MFGNGKIFVSHTHDDIAACEPVLAALDAWQVDYWFDTAQLSAGQEFFDYIQRALGERDIFLRICTPTALTSYWMGEEQKLARSLRAPNRSQRRLMINLILKAGYTVAPDEKREVVIDATSGSQVDWLQRLRVALGVPSRERRMSRRAALGLGGVSLAALGTMGFAADLFLNRSSAPLYLPTTREPTPTPLPGMSRVRWTYTLATTSLGAPAGLAADGITLAGGALVCNCLSEAALMALRSSDGARLWGSATYTGLSRGVPPTVVGDTVYFTRVNERLDPKNPNAPIDDTYLVALAMSDGSERWRQVIVTDYNPDFTFNRTNSAITVAGNVAYVRSNETLYAFDATRGTPLWRQSAGTPPPLGQVVPAPTVSAGVVYVILGDGKLHAFSMRDGSPVWPAPFAAAFPIRSQPVVADGVVYISANGGDCFALDAKTARVRWKTSLLKKPVDNFSLPGLTLSGGVLYISGGFPINEFDVNDTGAQRGSVQALDAATGAVLWTTVPAKHVELSGLQDDYLRPCPLVVGSEVFAATRLRAANSRNRNILFALDKTTGQVSWSVQMWGDKAADQAGAFPSAPVASGDTVYIATGNDTLYAVAIAG